jgi:hypothetical protein
MVIQIVVVPMGGRQWWPPGWPIIYDKPGSRSLEQSGLALTNQFCVLVEGKPRKTRDAAGLPARGGQPLMQQLCQTLWEAAHLLVLDNFEHLTQAAPQVAQLLEACPKLKPLTTSRSLLHLEGEQRVVLGPLPLPAPLHPAKRATSKPSPLMKRWRCLSGVPNCRARTLNQLKITMAIKNLQL